MVIVDYNFTLTLHQEDNTEHDGRDGENEITQVTVAEKSIEASASVSSTAAVTTAVTTVTSAAAVTTTTITTTAATVTSSAAAVISAAATAVT